jgi:anti-anti-sigma regulatory factor
MTNAFFLLILPTRSFTIHLGSHRDQVGLSLRGGCSSAADVAHLGQAMQLLLDRHPTHAWIDTQQLHSLSQLGQQALLRADTTSKQAGVAIHWCGLPAALRYELYASGLSQQLDLQPADSFNGPDFLLPVRSPATTLWAEPLPVA